MHDVPEVRAKLPQMAAYSSTFEMVVPSGNLSVGLQSPMVDSTFASFMDFDASNLEQALAPKHVQASQNCPHRRDSWMLVSRHDSLSVARRRYPDLRHWCHEIHSQDLPNLARASSLSCHEQFLLYLELVSVTEDRSDQKHTASWIMYDILHQTFIVAVAL